MSSPRCSRTRWSPGNRVLAVESFLLKSGPMAKLPLAWRALHTDSRRKIVAKPPNSFARPREGPASRTQNRPRSPVCGMSTMNALLASGALDRPSGPATSCPAGSASQPAELARIKSLVIPPAWTDVWICPDPHGHLQATGRDARGRKQYRYHPRWREVRDEVKYGRLIAFAQALPRIRQRTEADLRKNRSAARKGPRRRRAAAREDADSRRQRRVRARQRLGRADDDARPARDDQRRDGALRVPRQERRRARDRPAGRAARADRQGAAATCPATSCSSTWTRTAGGRRSTRPT